MAMIGYLDRDNICVYQSPISNMSCLYYGWIPRYIRMHGLFIKVVLKYVVLVFWFTFLRAGSIFECDVINGDITLET